MSTQKNHLSSFSRCRNGIDLLLMVTASWLLVGVIIYVIYQGYQFIKANL
jgi:hypothetical protein